MFLPEAREPEVGAAHPVDACEEDQGVWATIEDSDPQGGTVGGEELVDGSEGFGDHRAHCHEGHLRVVAAPERDGTEHVIYPVIRRWML